MTEEVINLTQSCASESEFGILRIFVLGFLFLCFGLGLVWASWDI